MEIYDPVVTTTSPKTRERILDVAFDLFVEVGFAGTTVLEIEQRAGLSSGSGAFYRHFRSKEELLPLAVEREVARCMTDIGVSMSARPLAEDPSERRVEWLTGVAGYIRRFEPLMRLMLADGHRVPEVRETVSRAFRTLGDQMSWDEHPELSACVVALGGYQLFSQVQGRSYQDVEEEEFVRVLAGMTDEVP